MKMKKQIIVVREEKTNEGRTWKPFLYEINIEKNDESDMTITDFYYAEKYSNYEKSFIKDEWVWDSVDGKGIVLDDKTVEYISWERTYDIKQRKRKKLIEALNDLSEEINVEEKIVDTGIALENYTYEVCFTANLMEKEITELAAGCCRDVVEILRNYASFKEALVIIEATWYEVEDDEQFMKDVNKCLEFQKSRRSLSNEEIEEYRKGRIGLEVEKRLEEESKNHNGSRNYIHEIIHDYIH